MGERGLLITGGGGFLGRFVLERYLNAYPDYEFHLLEHGPFIHKLRQHLDTSFPEAMSSGRIHVFEGDITQPGLGLEAPLREELKARVTAAIHLAALYHLAAPRDVLMRINVEGTRNLLDFCQELPRLERLAHVSTLAVAGTHTGTFDETDFDVGQSFKNFYEETKFLSEKLVRERRSALPSVIFRPAVVVGHSKTGYIDKVDGPYYLLVAISRHLQFIMPDCGPVKNNIAPVDFVTDGLVDVFEKDPGAIGTTVALMDPDPMTYNEFLDLGCQYWPRMKPLLRIPFAWFAPVARLKLFELVTGIPWRAFQYGNQVINYTLPESTRRLANVGVTCPPLTRYLEVLVQYFKNHLQDQAIRRGNWKSILKPE
ncbi:MAG TPA: SDR family oxidoreductase [Candidatus Hydrogenedentes bacterium]|jgi:thioester reductase-like protein|nr:SDR family oxidoreductase [Candidatus Hydrogenedentota bacterium]HOC70330.1 SDR family oxidoreductase [Candidatus Hydrogenedentota bacterium]HOH28692.1 SDR family oxidoreductase [Candidatus Hydrogenedentota bacterium]